MRTLKGKRLWPVLALAPVFALAAFLALGQLVSLEPPPVAAQGLPATTEAPTPADKCEVIVNGTGNADGKTVTGGGCTVSGDSVDVVFKNTATTPPEGQEADIYVTGGTEFPRVWANSLPDADPTDAATADTRIGKRGVDREYFRIPIQTTQAGSDVPGSAKVTVNRSQADDKGEVYLFVYKVYTAVGIPLTGNPVAFPHTEGTATDDHEAATVVKVVFRGTPVEKNAAGTTVSMLTASPISDDQESTITVQVQDKAGIGLNGYIGLSVEGGDSVEFKDSSQIDPKTHRVLLANGVPSGGATITVEGLPETGAVRTKVTGVFGGLTISTYIVRPGDAAAVEVKAYSCGDDAGEGDDSANGCDEEVTALGTSATSDDPKELTAVEPGDRFIIAGKTTDSAGNEVVSFKWEPADDDAEGALVGEGAEAVKSPDAAESPATDTQTGLETAIVAVAAGAGLGTYDIKVEDTNEDAETTVSFTVAGKTSKLVISGPDVIDGAIGVADYTVMATDAGGNVPTDVPTTVSTGVKVRVIVRTIGDVSVSGLDNSGNIVFANTGLGTFTVVMPADARQGTPVNIILSGSGGLSATKNVTFGMRNSAPTAVGSLDAITLAMGATSEAIDVSGAFSDADMDDTLTYTVRSANSRVATASVAGSMVTVTAVGAGMTTITVTATDPEGASARQSIAVTVPDTSLGNPTGLSATGGTGSATVSWTPAANATVHYVYSMNRDGSGGKFTSAAGDAGMVMVTDLTSGEYLFTVIAGQASADGMSTKWSSWAPWATASVQ